MEKTIMNNAAIFPYTMSFSFQPKDNESEGLTIDLPRGVYQLYLSQLVWMRIVCLTFMDIVRIDRRK